MVVPLAVLLAVSLSLAATPPASSPAHTAWRVTPPAGRCTAAPAVPAVPYAGDAPGTPWAASVGRFTRAAGITPSVIENYTPFGGPFEAVRVCEVIRLGALPLIQWNPRHAGMAAIAAGRYDRYLDGYARAVRAFHDPVILSFAHEMNGKWFPWGYTHTSPAVFIAAWRHVHDVFTRTGARNVIWLWNVNRDIHRSHPDVVSPPAQWWPGSRYVNWAGIDAYFNNPSDTFSSVFGVTLAALHRFTHDPVLITETAAGPGPAQARQIRSLFAGVAHTPGMLGFVWFDLPGRQDWHLENRPGAAAAFADAARGSW
jgi:hypothetical protein